MRDAGALGDGAYGTACESAFAEHVYRGRDDLFTSEKPGAVRAPTARPLVRHHDPDLLTRHLVNTYHMVIV